MTRRGLTLVELLVVIGIIVTLIGLLLPSLSKSREHARAVQCRSNLHQIGVLLSAYAAEYDGLLVPIGHEAYSESTRSWVDPLIPDSDQRDILRCPTADEYELHHTSYRMNIWLTGAPFRVSGSAHIRRSPAAIILMGERLRWVNGNRFADGQFAGSVGPDGPDYDPARHGPALLSNHLYADLHVDNIPPVLREGLDSPWCPWDP